MLESWSGEPAPSRALPRAGLLAFILLATPKAGFDVSPVVGSTGDVVDVGDPESVTEGCD